jgi:hypothetical protein
MFFLATCSRSVPPKAAVDLVTDVLGIDTTNLVLVKKSAIREEDVPYDSTVGAVALTELSRTQKSKLTDLIEPLSSFTNHRAYLLSVRRVVPRIATLAVFTQSELGMQIYLVNFRDTSLAGYIVNSDNYGNVLVSDNDKETVEGYDRWFEFSGDSVYQLCRRTIAYEYFNGKPRVKFLADSVKRAYRITWQGRFETLFTDSISFPTTQPR